MPEDRGTYCSGRPCSCTRTQCSWVCYQPYWHCLSSMSRTIRRSRSSSLARPYMESDPSSTSLCCRSMLLAPTRRSCRIRCDCSHTWRWALPQTLLKSDLAGGVLQASPPPELECASRSFSCCSPSHYLGTFDETARRTCRDRAR